MLFSTKRESQSARRAEENPAEKTEKVIRQVESGAETRESL